MEEIWKDVVGREGCYQVSNIGRVRSLDRIVSHSRSRNGRHTKGQMMKLHTDKDGYFVVDLKDKGKSHLLKVHRLVAMAFLLNPNSYKEVDHINGIRNDNRVENLRWCTCKQNQNFELARKNKSLSVANSYNTCQGLRELRSRIFSKSASVKVALYLNGEFVGNFRNQKELSKTIGISPSIVSLLSLGKKEEYKGYSVKRI